MVDNNRLLEIVWGVPSSVSLGNTATTDLAADSINLLSSGSGFVLAEEGGRSGWIPALPNLKNDGVRASSIIVDGSDLIAGALDNVTETMRVYITGANMPTRIHNFTKLLRFAEAARQYHEGNAQPQPVYLHWWAENAPGDQFALITKIEVSFDELDIINAAENTILTLSIEREPLWRGLAPGDNPKRWGFYLRGLKPTNSATPSGTEYNSTHLSLTSGAGSYVSFAEATTYLHDEIATTNVNYIDIAAANIDGDAPALVELEFDAPGAAATQLRSLRVGRSTRRDLFPANNNNTTTQRARNSFNPGDSSGTGAFANLTSTQLIQANGILTAGVRYVLNLAYAGGAVNNTRFAYWDRAVNQYSGLYAAFVRGIVSAGTPSEITLSLGVRVSNLSTRVLFQTDPIALTATYDIYYLGTLDFTQIKSRAVNTAGTGLDIAMPMRLEFNTSKVAGAAATVQLWDVLLIPIDEPNQFANGVVDLGSGLFGVVIAGNTPVILDSSGYFTSGDISRPVAIQNINGSEATPVDMYGSPLTLIPGVNNRLYIVPQFNGALPTVTNSIRVNIIPRWYGVRNR